MLRPREDDMGRYAADVGGANGYGGTAHLGHARTATDAIGRGRGAPTIDMGVRDMGTAHTTAMQELGTAVSSILVHYATIKHVPGEVGKKETHERTVSMSVLFPAVYMTNRKPMRSTPELVFEDTRDVMLVFSTDEIGTFNDIPLGTNVAHEGEGGALQKYRKPAALGGGAHDDAGAAKNAADLETRRAQMNLLTRCIVAGLIHKLMTAILSAPFLPDPGEDEPSDDVLYNTAVNPNAVLNLPIKPDQASNASGYVLASINRGHGAHVLLQACSGIIQALGLDGAVDVVCLVSEAAFGVLRAQAEPVTPNMPLTVAEQNKVPHMRSMGIGDGCEVRPFPLLGLQAKPGDTRVGSAPRCFVQYFLNPSEAYGEDIPNGKRGMELDLPMGTGARQTVFFSHATLQQHVTTILDMEVNVADLGDIVGDLSVFGEGRTTTTVFAVLNEIAGEQGGNGKPGNGFVVCRWLHTEASDAVVYSKNVVWLVQEGLPTMRNANDSLRSINTVALSNTSAAAVIRKDGVSVLHAAHIEGYTSPSGDDRYYRTFMNNDDWDNSVGRGAPTGDGGLFVIPMTTHDIELMSTSRADLHGRTMASGNEVMEIYNKSLALFALVKNIKPADGPRYATYGTTATPGRLPVRMFPANCRIGGGNDMTTTDFVGTPFGPWRSKLSHAVAVTTNRQIFAYATPKAEG